MVTSIEVKELFAALSNAQGDFDDAIANSTNPVFKSDYADMAAVRKAIKVPMSKYGLAIIQHPQTIDGRLILETIVTHTSGQWMKSDFVLNVEKPTMQGLKSAITYARRTAALSILGVAEADDDGNEAEKHPRTVLPRPKVAPVVPNSVVAGTVTSINALTPPGEAIIPYGPKKGRKVSELTELEIRKDLDYWNIKLKTDGKTAGDVLKNYLAALDAYLEANTVPGDPMPVFDGENLPF